MISANNGKSTAVFSQDEEDKSIHPLLRAAKRGEANK